MRSSIALLFLTFAACSSGERVAYYANANSVTVDGVSGDPFEVGNLGGLELTITGSGFGDDAEKVSVQFGSLNAEILSVTSSEITVISPKGPLSGGLVDIRVATAQGQGELLDAYEYLVNGATDNQAGYILLNDFWRDSFDNSEEALWVSGFGFFSSLEWYNFAFPRAHMGSIGWLGGTDSTGPEWVVQTPAYRPFVQAVDGLRKEMPSDIALTNPNASGSTCISWQPERMEGTIVIPAQWAEGDCNAASSREYFHGELNYCEVQEFETNTSRYAAEWPIQTPFMVPVGEADGDAEARKASCANGFDDNDDGLTDGQDPLCHTTVQLSAKDTGLNDDTLFLTFPESVNFSVDAAFTAIYQGAPVTNSAVDFLGCATDVEDAVMVIEWEPSGVVYSEHELIQDVQTNVRMTIAQFQAGWYGVSGFPIQATIVVPDVYNVNPETGRSQLVVTTELMDQFPALSNYNLSACTTDLLTNKETCEFRTADGNYGMLTYALNRVTEYRLRNENINHPFLEGGDLVVAYASGTFGLSITDHEPAIDRGTCDNCGDDDGDGWTDALDADCLIAEEENREGVEDGSLDGYGCSDGIDNDGNGLIDAEDTENCENGLDGETNCGNGLDDDGDGWVDELDGECVDQESAELGEDDPAWLCSDGLDNDGDGWIDAEEPGCVDGSGTSEGGFLGTACNDGIDNDGHMDVDSEDYFCVLNGPTADREDPEAVEEVCRDGQDNESDVQRDNFWDAFDPGCEKSPYFSEGSKGWKSTDPITTECYDTIDNDGDGLKDAEDPSCWNPDFGHEPDGFLNDEAAVWGTECDNGVDDDSDGLVDGHDPDCQPRYEAFQFETTIGSTQCNDGVDNDGDELIDSADPDCENAADDSE